MGFRRSVSPHTECKILTAIYREKSHNFYQAHTGVFYDAQKVMSLKASKGPLSSYSLQVQWRKDPQRDKHSMRRKGVLHRETKSYEVKVRTLLPKRNWGRLQGGSPASIHTMKQSRFFTANSHIWKGPQRASSPSPFIGLSRGDLSKTT